MQLTKKRAAAALTLYVLGLLVLFGAILFPDDTVRMAVESNIKRLDPNLGVDIGDAGPAFPFSIKLSDLRFVYDREVMATAAYLKVTPTPGAFFGAGPAGFFKMALFDGMINGSCRREDAGGYQAEARLSGLKLEASPLPEWFPGHRVEGDLSGVIAAAGSGGHIKATGELVLSAFILNFTAPVLGISEVRLDTVEAEIAVEGKTVRVNRVDVRGPDFTGEISGDVMAMIPYEMSRLRLKGFVRPQASFISRLSRDLPVEMMIRQYQGEQGIPLRIEGTIGKPGISFR